MSDAKIVEYEHHGTMVKVQEDLKGLHRNHCLCWLGCKKFKPGSEDNCERATLLFTICKVFNMVTPVWECPSYEK